MHLNKKVYTKTKLLDELFNNEVFVLKDIILKSGEKSPYYCNFRKLLTNPELYGRLIDYLTNFISQYDIKYDHLCGVPMGSLTITASLAYSTKSSQLLCRESAKNYGMKRLIEGDFKIGDKVLLIEDTMTTGSSVLETYHKLKNSGLEVENVIILFDREHEGCSRLEKENLNIYTLFSFKDLIAYLESKQFEIHVIESLKFYYDKTQKRVRIKENETAKVLTKKEIMERDQKLILENKFNKKLLKIIREKKTSVCLSLDIPLWKVGKKMLDEMGPYICAVKLHCDLIVDWNEQTIFDILELKKKHNFLVIEDAKYIDVSFINEKKLKDTQYNINKWVDAITVHWINYFENKVPLSGTQVHIICVGDMNTVNDPLSIDYSNLLDTINPVETSGHIIEYYNNIDTIVQQNKFKKCNNVLKMTPGVIESDDEIKLYDDKRYRSIENAILRDRNHVVIIGKNITLEENYVEKCKSCANLSWYYFNLIFNNLLDFTDEEEKENRKKKKKESDPDNKN